MREVLPYGPMRPSSSFALVAGVLLVALTSVRAPRPGLALHPAGRPSAAPARASDRARGHRRPEPDGPPVPPRRRRARARRGRHRRRRRISRASSALSAPSSRTRADLSGASPAGPAPRPSATSDAMSCIRSAPTASGRTRISPARRCSATFALVTRLAAEPRVADDPEWPGRTDLELIWRFPEAYVSAQFKYVNLFFGQMDRNWGPTGARRHRRERLRLLRRPSRASTWGPRPCGSTRLARDLPDETDTTGARVHRYFFAHRLGLRLSDRFRARACGRRPCWRATDREFDARYRNPVTLLLLGNQYRPGQRRQCHVRSRRPVAGRQRVLSRGPGRHRRPAIRGHARRGPHIPIATRSPLAASGPLGRRFAWRAFYTQASSLAFRSLVPVRELHYRRRGPGTQLRRPGPGHRHGLGARRDPLAPHPGADPAAARARAGSPTLSRRRRRPAPSRPSSSARSRRPGAPPWESAAAQGPLEVRANAGSITS